VDAIRPGSLSLAVRRALGLSYISELSLPSGRRAEWIVEIKSPVEHLRADQRRSVSQIAALGTTAAWSSNQRGHHAWPPHFDLQTVLTH
jgi:hypothetical protein